MLSRVNRARLKPWVVNTRNLIRYGSIAPLYGECVWIYPRREISRGLKGSYKKYFWNELGTRFFLNDKAEIVDSPFPERFMFNILDQAKFQYTVMRYEKNIPWADCGLAEFLAERHHRLSPNEPYDFYKVFSTSKQKYLDDIFSEIKKNGYVRRDSQLDVVRSPAKPSAQALHIDQHGELYFSGGGWHRFAMAYVLDVPYPARIGFVHRNALSYLPALRQRTLCCSKDVA